MPGVTNRGLRRFIEYATTRQWRDYLGNPVAAPTNFFVALVLSSGTQPNKDMNTLDQLSQPSGNGYPNGGNAVPPSAVGFPSFVEDDALDKAIASVADQLFSATGGNIGPLSKLVLTDDTGGSVAKHQVLLWFDILFDVGQTTYTIPDGTGTIFQQLTVEGTSP